MVAFFVPTPIFIASISLSLVGEVDTANGTIVMPGGIAAGDLCFASQYAGGGSAPSFGSPSGFAEVVNQGPGALNYGTVGWYKILTGSETTVSTGVSADEVATFCLVFRPSRSISAVSFGTWSKELTSGNPSPQAVNPAALHGPVITIGLAGANAGSFNSFGTFSPAADSFYDRDTGNLRAWLGYRIDNNTPQASTIDMADENTGNVLCSGYLALS